MLFLTIPTANTHPKLLLEIIKNSSLPPEQIILVATKSNLELPGNCIVIEDLGSPNIQRWWNVGIEAAINRGATAVAVLNDDLKIDDETLPLLYAELQRTNATIACPTRPDWGPGHYKKKNVFPYTPVIWGCLWMLNTQYPLRPDTQYVWWFGDSDLDIRARRDHGGIVTANVYYEHFFPGEGTKSSVSLQNQTNVDAQTFENQHKKFLRMSRKTRPRKIFLQTQQFAGRLSNEDSYRSNFYEYVSQEGDCHRDRIVLLEPNKDLHKSLQKIWSSWSNLVIVEDLIADKDSNFFPEDLTTMYIAGSSTPNARQSAFKIDVSRLDPKGEIRESQLRTRSLQSLIDSVSSGAILDTIVFDERIFTFAFVASITHTAREIIAITTTDSESAVVLSAKNLGFHYTGRPWGDAHTSAAFSLKRSHYARILRSKVGHLVSTNVTSRKSFRVEIPTLSAVSIGEVEGLLRVASHKSNSPQPDDYQWAVELDSKSEIQSRVDQCFSLNGVWPISFSYPRRFEMTPNPSELVSSILPRYPYAFDNEEEYLAKYADSYLALTHRKAGWDCLRHVEILASGSIPLMPDASDIPLFSMVHYPKSALEKISETAGELGGRPNLALRQAMRDFFDSYLTTEAMAKYICDTVGIPSSSTVLFVDENLSLQADYMSALTAIGLKEVLGPRCSIHFPVEYLYQDYQGDTEILYGKGFGYTKILDPSLRSQSEREHVHASPTSRIPQGFDYVIVGSAARNPRLTKLILDEYSPEKVVLIHGEDVGPAPGETRKLIATGASVFIRSI